jgi:hypothetical protein
MVGGGRGRPESKNSVAGVEEETANLPVK